MMKVTNSTFGMMAANRREKRIVELRKIRKDGTPGKATKYEKTGREQTAQDVIERMEKLNPGCKWIEA